MACERTGRCKGALPMTEISFAGDLVVVTDVALTHAVECNVVGHSPLRSAFEIPYHPSEGSPPSELPLFIHLCTGVTPAS